MSCTYCNENLIVNYIITVLLSILFLLALILIYYMKQVLADYEEMENRLENARGLAKLLISLNKIEDEYRKMPEED